MRIAAILLAMRQLNNYLLSLLLLPYCFGVHAQVKMYGMTTSGGDSSAGVIFSINSDGSNYQRLYSFKPGTDGASPRGTLVDGLDTKLYGLTSGGGPNNQGTVFAFDTLAHHFQKLADLGPATGWDAVGNLVLFKNKFYGLGGLGGVNGNGTIFSVDPFTDLVTDVFDLKAANGMQPFGSITVLNGLFYFTTLLGGTFGGGVLNVYDPGTGMATDLHDFPFSTNAWSGLVTINSVLYGFGRNGGSSELGDVYSYDPATHTYKETFKYDIAVDGTFPFGLTPFHGLLYGITLNGGKHGSGGTLGYVNQVTGGQSQLYAWDPTNNPVAGDFPSGPPTITNDALLLGMTSGGGTSGQGVIFSYDLHSNTYAKLLDFTGVSGGVPAGNSFLIPGAGQILPIRIAQFTGLLTESGRVLNWTATQPAAGGWFELERSTNEVNYSTIDSVAAVDSTGNGSALSGGQWTASYSYTDQAALPGTNVAYYRLKMTDDNQTVSYSNIVAIAIGGNGGDGLRLINTVVTGTAFLQYNGGGSLSTLDVRVTDMSGKVWIEQHLPVNTGVSSYSIDASALPQGMYVIQGAGKSIRFVRL